MGAANSGLSKCRLESANCNECCEQLEALECAAASPDLNGRDSQALMNHRLLKAAREGQVPGIRAALDAGASIETRRPFVMTLDTAAATTTDPTTQTSGIGLTPLMVAAEEGYTLACELLISKRACVNSEDEDGMRPLHFAAFAGSPETCRALIRAGADPYALDQDGRSALDHVPPHYATTPAERNVWKTVLGDFPKKTRVQKHGVRRAAEEVKEPAREPEPARGVHKEAILSPPKRPVRAELAQQRPLDEVATGSQARQQPPLSSHGPARREDDRGSPVAAEAALVFGTARRRGGSPVAAEAALAACFDPPPPAPDATVPAEPNAAAPARELAAAAEDSQQAAAAPSEPVAPPSQAPAREEARAPPSGSNAEPAAAEEKVPSPLPSAPPAAAPKATDADSEGLQAEHLGPLDTPAPAAAPAAMPPPIEPAAPVATKPACQEVAVQTIERADEDAEVCVQHGPSVPRKLLEPPCGDLPQLVEAPPQEPPQE